MEHSRQRVNLRESFSPHIRDDSPMRQSADGSSSPPPLSSSSSSRPSQSCISTRFVRPIVHACVAQQTAAVGQRPLVRRAPTGCGCLPLERRSRFPRHSPMDSMRIRDAVRRMCARGGATAMATRRTAGRVRWRGRTDGRANGRSRTCSLLIHQKLFNY